jgi:hypothetical protein
MSAAPNFFIVGAPKCGTTAMFDYLAAHPDVFMSRRKEPTFFARDLDDGTRADSRYFTRDLADYLSLFAGWSGEQRIGEGSVWYLYSEIAAREIKRFAPDARIIVMLRNPVEMMYSLHAQRLASGAEDVDSFEEALALEHQRAEGKRLPRNAFVGRGLLYRDVTRYANQVRRYIDVFGRGQVLVLLFEEFAADPGAAYRQVCDFLGIDPSFVPAFDRINQNTVVRSRLLRNVLRFHPRLFGWNTPGAPRRWWRRLRRALLRVNQRAVARQPLDPRLRDCLADEIAPDVEDLGWLLGRDLVAYWNLGAAVAGSSARPD